jgi:hypothetical protein
MKACILIAAVVLAASVSHLYAATITVTSTNDSGPGTLRYSLANAADGDSIDATGVTGTIVLTSGELLVTNSVTILGPGATNLAVNGSAASRVLYVGSNTVVNISSLTVTNGAGVTGHPFFGGGGLWNDHATLTVSNCVVSGSLADVYSRNGGGGILNDHGTLTVSGCRLSGNSSSAASGGGAICNDGSGGTATLIVNNSTFVGNSAQNGDGGAILNHGFGGSASAQISYSTLSRNSASLFGGAIENRGNGGTASVQIVYSTLSSNTAAGGGGIDNLFSSMEIINSTLEGNLAYIGGIINDRAALKILSSTLSANPAGFLSEGGILIGDGGSLEIGNTILNIGGSGGTISNLSGTVTSLGYNLSSDNGGGFLTGPGDQTNTDPMLGPLQDNGGPTFTCALLPGSPAINAGDPNFTPPPDFDQRGPGFPRVAYDRIDIGAFEVQTMPDSDGDGVPDMFDQCPNTAPGAIVDSAGCSIAQLVPCNGPATGGPWKNHGQYVAAVVQEATVFLKAGLISRRQWAQIVAQAARSRCGWNRRWDWDGDRDWSRPWDCGRDRDWGRERR